MKCFSSSNINNSSDYIKNKSNKIIYNNILDNKFKNIENYFFSNKNSKITLKSIGGFNINSQSHRINLTKAKYDSESFLFNLDNSYVIIEKENPSCQNCHVIVSNLKSNINLNYDLNNSSFLTKPSFPNISQCSNEKNIINFNKKLINNDNKNLQSVKEFINKNSYLNFNCSLVLADLSCSET